MRERERGREREKKNVGYEFEFLRQCSQKSLSLAHVQVPWCLSGVSVLNRNSATEEDKLKKGEGRKGVWEKGKWGEKPDSVD